MKIIKGLKTISKSGVEMIPIILYGKENETGVDKALWRICNSLRKINQNKEFCIFKYDEDAIEDFKNSKGIFVFKGSLGFNKNIVIPKGFIAVVSANNHSAASILRKIDVFAITCGTSPKDTMSISSIDYLNAVVSLQRIIRNIDGEVIEPQEFIVHLKEETAIYPLLTALTVFVLCNKDQNENIISF